MLANSIVESSRITSKDLEFLESEKFCTGTVACDNVEVNKMAILHSLTLISQSWKHFPRSVANHFKIPSCPDLWIVDESEDLNEEEEKSSKKKRKVISLQEGDRNFLCLLNWDITEEVVENAAGVVDARTWEMKIILLIWCIQRNSCEKLLQMKTFISWMI